MDYSNTDIDFIGIGFRKCGTTWIAEMLANHPEVDFSSEKEPFYFSSSEFTDSQSEVERDIINARRANSSKEYRALFAGNGFLKGEFTPSYIYDPVALSRIGELQKKPKILIAIRDPVSAAYSAYLFDNRYDSAADLTPDGFIAALGEESELYKRHCYSQFLRDAYESLSSISILLINFDDIKSRPKTVQQNIERFLGIKEVHIDDVHTIKNSGRSVRFKQLFMLLKRARKSSKLFNFLAHKTESLRIWEKLFSSPVTKIPLQSTHLEQARKIYATEYKILHEEYGIEFA